MSNTVYVIGHRNPDTDSICSAISYAFLKQTLGVHATPARAGKINAETKFVLDYFGVKTPELINDLYPRVKDVMNEDILTANPWTTLRQLGILMRNNSAKSVPIVNEHNLLVGIVSMGDLAKRYFDELEMQDLSECGASFADILKTLDGTLVVGVNLERKVGGNVRIAAAGTETITRSMFPGDVVLVGDRDNAQETCIHCKVACLIITGSAKISDEVKQAAEFFGTIIMTTPYDTYTAARLLNQSIPASTIMQKTMIAFKPTDLIVDIKQKITQTHFRNYPVVENNKIVGLINRDSLIVPNKEEIVLVDHNEVSQAVEGLEEAKVIEIIDHHRLGGFMTGEPIFIYQEPVGSTATIVARLFEQHGVDIPGIIAGLLLSAILSDTILFKSPTCTQKDRDMAEKLAALASLNIEEYGMAMLKAGANMGDMSTAEMAHNDLKEFTFGEYKYAISQLSVLDKSSVLTLKAKVLEDMESMRKRENYDAVLLMVTDILSEATSLLFTGDDGLIRQAFGETSEENMFYLPEVMSRKKQIVPPLVEAAHNL